MDRMEQSISIIESNQSKWGSYVASPNFSQYGQSWFRDGSFIAHVMAIVGRRDSSDRFFRWGLNTLKNQKDAIIRVLEGENPRREELLPARYTLDGCIADDDWPNAQNDGYGTFLWALQQSRDVLDSEDIKICDLCVQYLEKVWKIPCFDVWEEHPEAVHTSTLLSIAAGLKASESIISRTTAWKEIMDYVMNKLTLDGRLKKSSDDASVDSSLVWASFPFQLLDPHDSVMETTTRKMIEDLYFDGGVKRYRKDSYYGGGSWILLSAYLGGHMCLAGSNRKANEIWDWIESHFGDNGILPEQVPEYLMYEDMFEPWMKKWGPIASPLLWSHAAFLEYAALRKQV